MAAKPTFQPAPKPVNEEARLKALYRLGILDTPPEPQFDQLTHLAMTLTGCPISLITLIDTERQWFKACIGLDGTEDERSPGFCPYTILGTTLMEVPDATLDPRFAGNPRVLGPPYIRFYAGMPLLSSQGFSYGSLCVVDTKPGKLTAQQCEVMAVLARQVVWCMESRVRHENTALVSSTLTGLMEFLPDGLITTDLTGNIQYVNSIARTWHGVDPGTIPRQAWSRYFEIFDNTGRNRLPLADNPLSKVLRGDSVKDQEIIIRTKGQPERLVVCNADYLRDPDGHHTGAVVVMRDITASREASRSIADKNRRLAFILEGTRAGTWECNLVTGAIELNERWAEIIGYRLEELGPLTLQMLDRYVHPDDLLACRESLQQHLAGESPLYDVSMRMRHKKGHYVWVHDIGRVYEWNAQSQPARLAGTRLDITLIKQRDAEVASARNYLLELINAANDVAIVATDAKGLITLFNTGAEHMLGYAAREVVGKQTPVAFHLHRQVEQRARELSRQYETPISGFESFVHEVRKGGTDNRQWSYVCRDGSIKQVRLSISALHDDQGNVSGFLSMAMDLTRQLEAEEQARINIERFQRAFAAAAQGMAMLSVTGRWIDVNDSLCQMFGYTRDELMQLELAHITHADDLNKDLQQVRRTLDGEISHYQQEKRYLRKNGDIVHCILSASLVRDAKGWPMHFVLQLQDITAIKQMETMKNEFVSTVSHELRTPLTSISGALSLLLGGVLGEVPNEMRELLTVASQNSTRLSTLINDLLDMEKLVAGKMNFHFEVVELQPLLDEAVRSMENYAAPLGVGIECTGTLDVRINVDINRLQQILNNLLSNACKFSPPGGRVTLDHKVDSGMVEISVTDRGGGIPEAFKSRIFQKFSQADSSSIRSKGGTGLGLVICKELVERMHGTIGFESEEGKGTRFWFRLPCELNLPKHNQSD
ncbi:MAG TPA: PAS domain S-box protein [Candidatus Acidoferrum sp.]|nr:PAS domain S-box protein [Candidatus Acidoferrum sp.]